MAAISGYKGRVSVAKPFPNFPTTNNLAGIQAGSATYLPVTRWQVTWQVEKVDITNAEDSVSLQDNAVYNVWSPALDGGNLQQNNYPGVRNFLPGYSTFNITLECFWDSTLNSLSINLGSGVGPFCSVWMSLIINRDNSKDSSWEFNNVIIENFTMEQEVRGVCKYNVSGWQDGPPIGFFSYFPTN